MKQVSLPVVALIGALSLAAGALGYAFIGEALGSSGSSDTHSSFCVAAGEWHSTFAAYLRRANSPGSRSLDGLPETRTAQKANLLVVLPDGANQAERDLRELLRQTTRSSELWVSELGQSAQAKESLLALTGPTTFPALYGIYIDAYQKSEETRIQDNFLQREASYRLAQICGTEPLPIYSSE